MEEFTTLKKSLEHRLRRDTKLIVKDLESLESALDTHFETLNQFAEVLL